MPTTNLNQKNIEVNDGLDSIVIIKDLGDIPGGRTLDVSGLDPDVEYVRSGHILIQNNSTKAVSPLGVTEDAYVALPSGHAYYGVNKTTISVKDARAAILTVGQVNAAASPYPVTTAIKSGLPNIQFLY